ncbi:MAG: hypothetical protein IT370_02315 [Deltaproteobacteria bacterium]|nr:hypothetical protein [Deltaproteobacteria bacterium]
MLAALGGAGCRRTARKAVPEAAPDAGAGKLAGAQPRHDAGVADEDDDDRDDGDGGVDDEDEPWAGDAFPDAPEPSDDVIGSWSGLDQTHREFWFGLWHASVHVSDGYNDRLALYSDGRFIVRADQYGCGDGLSAARGTWTLEGATLVLVSTWRDRTVGSVCNRDELETEGGTTVHEHTAVTHRLRIKGCRKADWGEDWSEHDDLTCRRLVEAPGPAALLINHGGPFWQIDSVGELED